MRYLLQVELTVDSKPLPGFPYVRTLDVPDTQGTLPYLHAPSGLAELKSFPAEQLLAVNGLVITADEETCWFFNGQQDGIIPLDADGVIVLWDVVLDDGEQTNVTVLNPGDTDVNISGIALGDGVADTVPVGDGFGEGAPTGGFGE